MPGDAAPAAAPKPSSTAEIDALLTAQLAVAWAGEGDVGDTPRLGWWRSDLASEFGGQDLFERLLPRTHRWAVLQAVREAARRRDAELRAKVHNPDGVVSLFRLGFEIDERADERLLEFKRDGVAPEDALPALREVLVDAEDWDRGAFLKWITAHGEARTEEVPLGRRLVGDRPASLREQVARLVAALAPLGKDYPLPHFRGAK